MLLKSTAPICPVCLSGSSPGWARACDDADRMTAGARRGECQCGRAQFPHDLQHIQTHSLTNTHSHTDVFRFLKGVQQHLVIESEKFAF